MEQCKATIQEGARRGLQCKFPPTENGYCGRHTRNKKYDDGVAAGITWCRFFFRGCDTQLRSEEVAAKTVSCSTCRSQLAKKEFACKHEGCAFKVKEEGFCKKHERDKYRLEEQEKGIRYCDIDRGCFTLCKDGMTSCDDCLERARHKDATRYTKRKEVFQALQANSSDKRICVHCATEFDAYITQRHTDSVRCKKCNEAQAKEDAKRAERKRNYKLERYKNIKSVYREYISRASKKGREISINFETFVELITSPCYYCGYDKENEVIGIDRRDNARGYEDENCVPCCETCNMMKSFYQPDFFIDKCKIIAKVINVDRPFYNKWDTYYSRTNNRNYTAYKQEATLRNLPFELTERQWDILTHSPCYMCGYASAKGIGLDRFNNTIRAYTLANTRPCCGSCNGMKGELSYEFLVEHCKKIADKWPYQINFAEIPVPENPCKANTRVQPPKERKVWKALGLYYAILSDTAESFYDSYSGVYTSKEYSTLCTDVKGMNKDDSIKLLQTLIQTLKKRKQRAALTLYPPTF
jgi:hypothetical protein